MAGRNRLRWSSTEWSGLSFRRPAGRSSTARSSPPPAGCRPERHLDPPAKLDRFAQPVGHEVIELLGRPRRQQHRGHQLLRLVVRLPRRRLGLEELTLWG